MLRGLLNRHGAAHQSRGTPSTTEIWTADPKLTRSTTKGLHRQTNTESRADPQNLQEARSGTDTNNRPPPVPERKGVPDEARFLRFRTASSHTQNSQVGGLLLSVVPYDAESCCSILLLGSLSKGTWSLCEHTGRSTFVSKLASSSSTMKTSTTFWSGGLCHQEPNPK